MTKNYNVGMGVVKQVSDFNFYLTNYSNAINYIGLVIFKSIQKK